MSKMSDTELLTALREAHYYYTHRHNMTRQERLDGIISLAEWDLFSIAQLSQLSGYSTASLYGWKVKRGHNTGRFNPYSLDALVYVLLDRINGQRANPVLLKSVVDDGNSHRTIYKLTGVQPSTVSRILKRINDYPGTDL